ncbi:unnamed protein product [Phyllotreta striolata]|uniref:Uncharacterized protein n=1 Tax=Phyllotreta striolata TaxID=444603 RepID=A0A9N9TTD0_PHYSR|nr:unnamed protein product [Phyllotreta striolata]
MLFEDNPETTIKHTLRQIRHDNLFNSSEESLFEGTDRTFSQVFVELPYPVHVPLRTSEDLAKKLLKEKAEYNNLRESIRRRFTVYDENRIIKEEQADERYITLPRYMIDWRKRKNPDDTFNSHYNYYYTGGNLEYFRLNDNVYLIRPDVNNKLCITNVSRGINLTKEVARVNFHTETPIFNINSTECGNDLYFTIREKQTVNVVKCDETLSMTLKYSKTHQLPVLDSKLYGDDKIGFILPNGKLNVTDITTDQTIFSTRNELTDEIDNFQQFRFLNEQTILLMDRAKIKLIDMRSNMHEMCFEPQLLKCNGFYNFVDIKNTLLVASMHYILKTDLRNLTKVSHYSHTLSEAPCYLDYTKTHTDIFLVVSGQNGANSSNKVLFTGKSPYSIPYKIPSLKKTLIETQLSYPELVLEQHLENRLSSSITGTKVLNLDNTISIFSSNCYGEIFKQNVFESEPSAREPIEVLHEWTKTLSKPKQILHVTHFEDITDVMDSLKQKAATKPENSSTQSLEKPFLQKFNIKYSDNIKSQLAKDFLSIWEDSDDNEDETEDLDKENVEEKVNQWIELQDFDIKDHKSLLSSNYK